ncbi:MAG: hypothetical protein JJE17_01330 [Peptostreptococcaceae bacterium]|nr:hypothetical protein [Peptostreptococcaceae bacterium]
MKKVLLTLVLVIASLPVFAYTMSNIDFYQYQVLGTSIYDLVTDKSDIDVDKKYNIKFDYKNY